MATTTGTQRHLNITSSTLDASGDVLSSGNVGIGTSSPSAPLVFGKSVYGGFDSENFYRIKLQDQGGTLNDVGIGQTASGSMGFNITSGGTFIFNNGTSGEIARFNGAGLGIGTTSPRGKLDIVGNTDDDTDFLTIQDNDTSAGSHRPSIRFRSNTAQIGQIVSLDNSMRFSVGTTEDSLLEITSSGNVGVGTATPLQPFQVDAGSNIASFRSVGTGQNNKELLIQTGGDRVVLDAKNADDGTAASLAFELGNSEKARLTTTGLGIGTTSPGYPLEVQSGGVGTVLRAGAAFVSIDSAGTASSPSLVFNGDTNTGIFRPSSDVLAFSTASTERMRVLANGNVGIGTTSPGAKFHVIDSSSSNVLAKIRVQGGTTSGYAELGSQSNYARILSNGNLTYAANSSISYFYVNGSAAATIDSTGMGIGTTSPSNKLVIQTPFTTSASDSYIEINSGHEASGGSDTSGASGILFKQSGSGNVLRSAGSIISGRESNYSTDNQADSYLSFLTAVNNVNTEKIRITSTGQVGFNNYTSATSFTGTAVASLAVDSSGNIITEAAGGGGGGNTTVVVDTFSGDNSDVTFNITNTIANEDNVQIYIDGVYQSKSNYSTSGVTITFSTAPPSGTNNIEVTHFVQINGAPSIEVDTFNGNASTTVFTLTTAPATKNNLQIYIDGVYQAKANYSVSGTTLTFTTAPAAGTNNIEVTHLKIS